MQEISQKWTNKVHRRQVDMGPLGGVGWCHMASPNDPPGLPHHWSTWYVRWHPKSPLHAWFQVDLIQRLRWSSNESMGPLSSTWRGQTDLTALPAKAIDLSTCNCHPGGIHHRWMVRRCRGRLDDAPCLSAASLTPTSNPLPSTHYKRGSGARWRSSPKHSKHSKLSKKLSRVVA
jgi:hypothetical protein